MSRLVTDLKFWQCTNKFMVTACAVDSLYDSLCR